MRYSGWYWINIWVTKFLIHFTTVHFSTRFYNSTMSNVLKPLSACKVTKTWINCIFCTANTARSLVDFIPTTKRHPVVASLYENVVQYRYFLHRRAHSMIFDAVVSLFNALFGNNSVANFWPRFNPFVRKCIGPKVVRSVNTGFTANIRITFVNNAVFELLV